MKIRPKHYQHIKAEIAKIDSGWVAAHRQAIIAEGKAKDVEKRLRWDLSYAAKLSPWICATVYSYANDVHLDTALRSVMADLGHTKTEG